MPFTLKPVKTAYQSGKQIIASEVGLKFVEGGATLDAANVGNTTLPVGYAVARNKTSGKWEKFTDAADTANTYDDYGILNIDVVCNGTDDVIVGEIIVAGSVYDAKLDASVTAQFKTKTKGLIRYVKHV